VTASSVAHWEEAEKITSKKRLKRAERGSGSRAPAAAARSALGASYADEVREPRTTSKLLEAVQRGRSGNSGASRTVTPRGKYGFMVSIRIKALGMDMKRLVGACCADPRGCLQALRPSLQWSRRAQVVTPTRPEVASTSGTMDRDYLRCGRYTVALSFGDSGFSGRTVGGLYVEDWGVRHGELRREATHAGLSARAPASEPQARGDEIDPRWRGLGDAPPELDNDTDRRISYGRTEMQARRDRAQGPSRHPAPNLVTCRTAAGCTFRTTSA